MADLFINLLSSRSLASADAVDDVVGTLSRIAPTLSPEKYGNWEPLRTPFSSNADLHGSWKSPFLWLRKRPSATGSVFMVTGPRPQHASVTMAARSEEVDPAEIKGLLLAWAEKLDVDFAFLHRLTHEDVQQGIESQVVSPIDRGKTRFTMFVTTQVLSRGLPDVYWGTVLGPPYVKLFSREVILSAPAFSVTELRSGAIYIQLTAAYTDSDQAITSARERLKEHLGPDAFSVTGRSAARVPLLRVCSAGAALAELS